MTKEELKQKAEEYALEKCKECYMCNSEENGERGYCPKLESRKEGYLAGAEPREKRIAELEAQIEKMKYCGNCIHHESETYDCRAFCYYEDTCKNHSKWKLKEIKEK